MCKTLSLMPCTFLPIQVVAPEEFQGVVVAGVNRRKGKMLFPCACPQMSHASQPFPSSRARCSFCWSADGGLRVNVPLGKNRQILCAWKVVCSQSSPQAVSAKNYAALLPVRIMEWVLLLKDLESVLKKAGSRVCLSSCPPVLLHDHEKE